MGYDGMSVVRWDIQEWNGMEIRRDEFVWRWKYVNWGVSCIQ